MAESVRHQKTEWRQRLKCAAQMDPSLSERACHLLTQRLQELPGRRIAAYSAIGAEVDVTPLLAVLREHQFYFPQVQNQHLRFFPVTSVEHLQPGQFGVREPQPGRTDGVELEALDVALVPGLAFDRQGVRLGRGLGFYDRSLATFKGVKLGICSSQFLVERLPAEAHDIVMDEIVTEAFILRPISKIQKGLN